MELGEKYKKRLEHIKTQAENLWKKHKFPQYFFTPHDTNHSKGVIDNIYKLLQDRQDRIEKMNFSY